jgi:hypothetical protein
MAANMTLDGGYEALLQLYMVQTVYHICKDNRAGVLEWSNFVQ